VPNQRTGPGGQSPDSRLASVLRASSELIAWIATPWALWSSSIPLAILSVVVLIGLPTVFTTPGDKAHGMIPVPGVVTIALVLMELAAAVISSWSAWYPVIAIVVSVLAVACVVAEIPRWRWLVTQR
jgi:mannose/fructose/N-acetylgalactosamine-specific phosphotransferase system component IIC